MTYKEKLINLLCTVDEIKEDFEKIWPHKWFRTEWLYNYWFLLWPDIAFFPWRWCQKVDKEFLELQKFQWELEERHLRMYLNKFKIDTWDKFISRYSILFLDDYLIIQERNIEDYSMSDVISLKLDNTKSFDNQSEEVYEKIFNYLTK